MKIFSLVTLILFTSLSEVNAQFHLGTYSFAAVGIGGPVTDRLDLEGKLFANTLFSEVTFEGLVMFNLKPGSFHQFSAGAGFNANAFDDDSELSLLFPVELEIYPLTSFRRLSLLIELAPQFYITEDELILRHMWGVRYYFKDPR